MLHDATIWNPFNSEYFFWLDAGITNTVPHTHLVENNVLNNLIEHGNPFLFLSYPYEANTEIHGFEIKSMNMYAGQDVKYVCRGGLFGGHKDQIKEANSTYYSLLQKTLNSGNMGTEESLFTIMAYNEPDLYKRYELDGNGLIVKVRYRGPDKYRTFQTCNNNDSEWDGVETYSSSSASENYSTFSNIRLNRTTANFCFSKNFTVNFTGNVSLCHKEKNTNAICQLVNTNDPYYDLIIQRTGRSELLKYSYAQKGWIKQ
jgi:hypothetical protein